MLCPIFIYVGCEVIMDPESDETDSQIDPFIVPDSQKPLDEAEENSNNTKPDDKSKTDQHAAVLKGLQLSWQPEKGKHEQGKFYRY